jgi:hypothetical protein
MKILDILFEDSKKNLPDGGDCFDSSYDFILKNGKENSNLMLVHGIVSGHGELSGYRFTHAWCEDDEFVYDNSNNRVVKIPKIIYYSIGNINPEQSKTYTYRDVLTKSNEQKNKGPWDIENVVYKEKFDTKTRKYN